MLELYEKSSRFEEYAVCELSGLTHNIQCGLATVIRLSCIVELTKWGLVQNWIATNEGP